MDKQHKKALMQVYGERLRDSRGRAGLTGEQLAELVGVTEPFISLMERGERLPSVETAIKIEREIGCAGFCPTCGRTV